MSIEIKSDILAKELNQGIVPLGVPKAYQYDAALVEAARAAVNQGIDDVAEAGATAVTSVKVQESTSTTNINTLGDKILAQMKHGYGYPFTAATAAAMADTTKIYVYTGSETGYTNGDWYYWNGTAWTSGGVYNATALETDKTLTVSGAAADAEVVGDDIKSIKSENQKKQIVLSDDVIEYADNMFDERTAFSNMYLDSNTGEPFDSNGYITSDFIPVSPNTTYVLRVLSGQTVSWGLRVYEYDSVKNFIRYNSAGNITTTENTYYVRVTCASEDSKKFVFGLNSRIEPTVTYYYQPKLVLKSSGYRDSTITGDAFVDKSINATKVDFVENVGNLFDINTYSDNTYLNTTNGYPFTIDGYYTSDFISVKEGEIYTATLGYDLIIGYKKDKTFSQRIYQLNASTLAFEIPNGVNYIRIVFKKSASTPETTTIEKGYNFATYSADCRKQVISPNIKIDGESINGAILKSSTNLFDLNHIIRNWYLLGNGELMKADGYYTSDYIPCEPSTSYFFYPSGMERIVYFGDDKATISEATGVYNAFTTPANAKYFRFTNALNRAILERIQITNSSYIIKYESFDEYAIKPKQKRIWNLSDAWWHWSMGEKFPIGFLGDSTTDGAGTTHGATHEEEDTIAGGFGLVDYINTDAYPYKLQELIRTELNSSTARVYNIGYSGTYYDWAIPKYDNIFGNAYADVKMVGLVYGINDRTLDTTEYEYYTKFRNNLVYTINYLYTKGIQPFLVTTQATVEPWTRDDMQSMSLRSSMHIKSIADKVMQEVAEEYGLEIIDMNSFDDYLMSFSSYSVNQIIPDTLHYSDLGNTLEAGFLFSQINQRTIVVENDCTLSFARQFVKSRVYSNWLTKNKADGFNCSVDYTRTGDNTNILLQDFWVEIKTDGIAQLSAHCTDVIAQYIVVDGVQTAITATSQNIAMLDIGVHHIEAWSGESTKLNWQGFKIQVN
ncbi:SGNH/GDSL hydrolase family protein [Selenomonas ruminantium]|uniref:SGNH/GDSL hydrolase family protein n=1 Tax=Selenomonas ruminantium TaxID=971 RepID=UPI0026ED250E|nr:SGNH/GDSL hydrolase family protein [Selenomonas ruminantium]